MPDFSLISPKKVRFGWAGIEKSKIAWDLISAEIPPTPFFIAQQTVGSDGARLVLWDYTKKVVGKHLPCFRQEEGDCVSEGMANAVNYLSCMEIIRLGQKERFRSAYQPYIYGISRVQIGKKQLDFDLNESGSLGIWACEGVKQYGILAVDVPNVPPYSGEVAKDWGFHGPPAEFIPIGQRHLVQTTSRVVHYEQVRDAILNGYPITVASSQGFKMRGVVDRGKLWGQPSGTWQHQMVFIGVDDDSSRPGCYCLNSWGATAHGDPPDDAPPGGFWVDAHIVEKMVSQGDSHAISQFDGFPEQKLDFMLI